MLKSELIRRLMNHVTDKYPQVTGNVIAESTHELLKHITETLLQEGRLEIRGFGTLSVHTRPTRMARNPKTGENVSSPGRAHVQFRSAKKLRLRLNASYR